MRLTNNLKQFMVKQSGYGRAAATGGAVGATLGAILGVGPANLLLNATGGFDPYNPPRGFVGSPHGSLQGLGYLPAGAGIGLGAGTLAGILGEYLSPGWYDDEIDYEHLGTTEEEWDKMPGKEKRKLITRGYD